MTAKSTKRQRAKKRGRKPNAGQEQAAFLHDVVAPSFGLYCAIIGAVAGMILGGVTAANLDLGAGNDRVFGLLVVAGATIGGIAAAFAGRRLFRALPRPLMWFFASAIAIFAVISRPRPWWRRW